MELWTRRRHRRPVSIKQLAFKLSGMIKSMRDLPSWMEAGDILAPFLFVLKIAPNLSDSGEGSPPAGSAPLLIASMTPALPPLVPSSSLDYGHLPNYFSPRQIYSSIWGADGHLARQPAPSARS